MPPTNKTCISRLQRELKKLKGITEEKRKEKESGECNDIFFDATPDPNNILVWYFFFEPPPPKSAAAEEEEKKKEKSSKDSSACYTGGRYLGKLQFPSDYPYKPPKIFMLTPSGRLEVNKEICLSNSSFHPESWSPLWGLDSLLLGLISFFLSEERTNGSLQQSEQQRRLLAASSRRYNCVNLKAIYSKYFPSDYAEDCERLDAPTPSPSPSPLTATVVPSGSENTAPSAVIPTTTTNNPPSSPQVKKKKKDIPVFVVVGVLAFLIATVYYVGVL